MTRLPEHWAHIRHLPNQPFIDLDALAFIGWIEFAEGPLSADMPAYDLVCANLTVDVIMPILDLLLAKTLSILLLSGILFEQKDIISSALSDSGVSHFRIERSGEWISVIIDRSESCD